jgi:hypothetical protein
VVTARQKIRRLPGFRFEAQAPPLPETLPRMDVAIFVGFAASGPIGIPVAVETVEQFTAIFGADLPLAWDRQRGEQTYAYLAPAVRAFFRNGGVRCWIVRVAKRKQSKNSPLNRARYNYFPVPGLAEASFDKNGKASVMPALARARAEGSWSDDLRASATLLARPVQITKLDKLGNSFEVELRLAPHEELDEGDVLRLRFADTGKYLLLAVDEVEAMTTGSPPVSSLLGQRNVRVKSGQVLWTQVVAPDTQQQEAVQVSVWTHQAAPSSPPAEADEQTPTNAFRSSYDASLTIEAALTNVAEPTSAITLDVPGMTAADAPAVGSLAIVEQADRQLLLLVEQVERGQEQSGQHVRLHGRGLWCLQDLPPVMPATSIHGERLTFELWVKKGTEYSVSMSDLAFHARHALSWARLQTDEDLFRITETKEFNPPAIQLWRQVGDLFRFPLAGNGGEAGFSFPVFMPFVPAQYLVPIRLQGTSLERDGLAEFDAALFLDQKLKGTGVGDLLNEAEFARYFSPQPRRLDGIHAALAPEETISIAASLQLGEATYARLSPEEATLIAVPDAVHRGWRLSETEKPPAPEPSKSPLRPEWWHFQDCSKPDIKPVSAPQWGNFLDCSIRVIPPPALSVDSEISLTGTYTLFWSASPPASERFELEESANRDFADATIAYSGPLTELTLYGRNLGDYYYRVRALSGEGTSDWSNGVVVRITSANRWVVKKEEDYAPETLLAVQRALLRVCAARGDLLAALSLPEHYREDQSIAHVADLKTLLGSKAALDEPVQTEGVALLSFGEAQVLSYGAVYHPWLNTREDNSATALRRTPPCGAALGMLAQRALNRGAWIAPANEELKGVLALAPPLLRERRLDLQEASINLIQQEPRGFMTLNTDTLSDDAALREINVRRLLILLRRLALKHGAEYVFEPNDERFRRVVERGFTALLDYMFVRGAFAGATPKTSYQVVVDSSLNNPQSVEQGRFIVELRVAPSLPLRFLTIRLVQTGARGFVTERR